MKWIFKKFETLKLTELYDLLKLRSSVFVVEQDCVYQDLDEKDQQATHLLGYENEKLIAYSRIFSPGTFEKKYSRIGRIVTKKQYRGKGIGQNLVQRSIDFCAKQFNRETIKVSAQVYLKKFYNQQGFVEKGKIYNEDGIPHHAMFFLFKP